MDIKETIRQTVTLQTRPRLIGRVLWPEPYNVDEPEAVYRFLTECCWTYNEADKEIDLIPAADYIRTVVYEWHAARTQSRTLVIEKSRRMLISWVLRACELWSLGMRNEKGLITGLDYDKAAEHLWRIWFLYHELQQRRPELDLPNAQPRGGNVAAQKIFQVILPNGSLAETLNQDGLSFQGAGYGWVTMEEFSRYNNCDYMFAQAIRVTEGKAKTQGGNVVIVTNASPDKSWQEIKALKTDLAIPSTGLRVADCKNGCRYVKIHYSADPGKTIHWAENEKSKVPIREWLREMEMSEDIYQGEPVFADYRESRHNFLKNKPLPIVPNSTYIGGWDAGQTMNPAFVLLQITPAPFQVHALLEVLAPGTEPMEKFAPRVMQQLMRLLPNRFDDIQHWGDTTIVTRNGCNGETAKQTASHHGIRIRPGSNGWSARYGAVTWLLLDDIDEVYPRFIIDGSRCPVLRDGFRGAYHLDPSHGQGPERIYPNHPKKDGYSHVHDALQYAACRAKAILT